jgi:hypothetical protein
MTSKITEIRDRIGEEYMAMCNTFDSEIIAEKARAIEMLSQELIEACTGLRVVSEVDGMQLVEEIDGVA